MFIKFIFLAFSRFYSTFVGLVLLLLSTEILGFEQRGQIAISISWMTTIFTISYLSLGQIGYKIVVDDNSKISNVISIFFIYSLLVTLSILLLVYPIYKYFLPNGSIEIEYFIFSVILIPGLMLEQQMLSLFIGKRDTSIMNKITIIVKTFILLLSILLIYLFPSKYLFISLLSLMSLLLAFSFFYNLNKDINFKFHFDFTLFKKMLLSGLNFHFFNAFGYILYTQLPLLVLPWFFPNDIYAKYEITFKFLSLLTIIATTCQLLGMRIFSNTEISKKVAWKKYISIVGIYFLLSYCIVGICYLIKPILFNFNFFNEYQTSYILFLQLALFIPFMNTSAFLPTLFLNLNKLNLSAIYNVLLGLISLILISTTILFFNPEDIFNALKIVYIAAGMLFLYFICALYKRNILNDQC
ncbi:MULTISPECIES: hypothetical protein [Proteus]|uniref:Wzx n=2 Tax=Enterobacterales TaxID=91347 RepID=A0ABY8Y873_9GAMM|nr:MULTISPECIES: hypothetical protein [Proteus]MCF1957717.1 hypothetical protein [Escherichia coli]WIV88497.1 hypothetical protein QQS39_00275 [Proteus sp. HZ0627]